MHLLGMLLGLSTLFGFCFFVSGNGNVYASMETDKDLIDKAQQLLLQKERVSAISILTAAAQREAKLGNNSNSKALTLALEEISTTFILDKAQQSYELAMNLQEQEPEKALAKLEEAARIEPKNFLIELQLVRVLIGLNQCAEALNKTRSLASLNPFSTDVQLAEAQAALCAKEVADYKKLKTAHSGSSMGENRMYWDVLAAQEFIEVHVGEKQSGEEGILDRLRQSLQEHSAFPESYYWLWRLDQFSEMRTNKPPLPMPSGRAQMHGEKYLTACKNPSKGLLRKHFKEPFLCRRISEVEAQLKRSQ